MKKRGITLIEVLIVIVLIITLAIVIWPGIKKAFGL